MMSCDGNESKKHAVKFIITSLKEFRSHPFAFILGDNSQFGGQHFVTGLQEERGYYTKRMCSIAPNKMTCRTSSNICKSTVVGCFAQNETAASFSTLARAWP
jgi:hypothetical protein